MNLAPILEQRSGVAAVELLSPFAALLYTCRCDLDPQEVDQDPGALQRQQASTAF